MFAAWAASVAAAADGPSLWLREFGAAVAQPTGVMTEVTAELRTPILRYGGVAFNGTFVGAGVRLAVTPVHVDTALRVDLQPIDVLPITIEAFRSTFWESPWGMTPASTVADQKTRDRRPLYDQDLDFAATAYGVSLIPTVQLRVGPVAGFSTVGLTWMSIRPAREDGPAPWVFEPFRGMVLAPNDRVMEHTSAILWERHSGEDGTPILRVGPVLRGKTSAATRDTTLNAGAVLQWRPGCEAHDPTLLFLVAPYLRDPDFLGPMPMLAAVVTVEQDLLLRPSRAARARRIQRGPGAR